MRCVVFDPFDMEALTVIDVPQEFIRELESGRSWNLIRFSIEEPFDFALHQPHVDPLPCMPKIAEVRIEPFTRGSVRSWCGIALNPEICLLMKSELLPGQRRDDQERQESARRNGYAKGFETGFIKAINLLME